MVARQEVGVAPKALGVPRRRELTQVNVMPPDDSYVSVTRWAMMRLLLTLAAITVLLGGFASAPGADRRYATPGRGGWDSFRAETPTKSVQLGLAGGGQ